MNSICDILKKSKNIAVVGISNKPYRDSGSIARFLKENGYNVFGVNPVLKEFAGIKIFPSLKEIPEEIDIVDVFRRSSAIPEIVDDALLKKPKVVWLQLGIRNDDAVSPLIEQGIEVIQDRCIKIEYNKCFF